MGLIESEIGELRALCQKIYNGDIDNDKARTLIGVYNQTAKRESMLLQIFFSSEKNSKRKIASKLSAMNVINENGAIGFDEGKPDVVKCPEMGGKLINRETCLDYSGDQRHIDACQKCEQFEITRKYCLHDTEMS
jgi:hypothetical protein